MYQIWRIYLDLWGHDCKKLVWPTFGCKLGQSDPIVMQIKLDMSCHLLNVYTKFQIDISKHVEEKSGKRGRTDGRTLPRHNTSRFSNGRIKIRFQTRQFGHQWSCQNTCWVQLGHVSSALSALRPWAAKMAPILWSILSRQVQDNSDLSENLTGLMTIFTDISWAINH